MFQFYAEDSDHLTGERDLDLVRTFNPDLQSFTNWLKLNEADVKATVN